jgi:transcriptional regulator with XRE-family HTH domain
MLRFGAQKQGVFVMGWKQEYHALIEEAVAKAGSAVALAKATGISRQAIGKWLAKQSGPTATNLAKIMQYMGVQPVQVGQERVEAVSFGSIEWDGVEMPSSSDYAAVPILRDPDAIDGDSLLTPKSNIASWALPLADSKTVRNRPHTIALMITDTSMSPLLDPGDIVYVDRADVAVQGHGEIFLVRDARTGSVCIRRVTEYEEDGELYLLFTADNPRIAPRHFSVKKHFGGNRRAAVLGRAVTARVDLTNL